MVSVVLEAIAQRLAALLKAKANNLAEQLFIVRSARLRFVGLEPNNSRLHFRCRPKG